MRILVLLNETAGTLAKSDAGDESQRIKDGFAAAGADVEVRFVGGADLANAANAAVAGGIDVIVGGGGDGTLNTIAAALAGSTTAFGVLPLGTHNHFAKELGVPLELGEAIGALARGKIADLDLGEVNGRIFLNFSGLGLHPRLIKHREAQRETRGRKKVFAMFIAFFSVLRRPPVMRLKLIVDGQLLRRTTSSLIVCNNAHQMKVFGVEDVSTHDRDRLNIYIARSTRWFSLVWLMLRAVFRSLRSAKKFEVLVTPQLTVQTPTPTARVSIDGEVMDMETPLHYRIRRAALKVILPAGQAIALSPNDSSV